MSAEAYYPLHRCVKRASFKNTAPPKGWSSERGEGRGERGEGRGARRGGVVQKLYVLLLSPLRLLNNSSAQTHPAFIDHDGLAGRYRPLRFGKFDFAA